jgi:propionyl-CoA carboxylase alpha subunit
MTLPQKVLVANRGEIAVRIIRTLRRLGITSVAVYHAEDAGGRALREADEAVELHGVTPVGAYLNIEEIVAACRSTGATAVHPGVGFLAENAVFAETLAEAGITFIGPRPGAIRAMGDKLESKRLAARAGFPVLPGSEGPVANVDEAVVEADRIGYPVLLKASAGGGGKGMRIALTAADCRDAFERATSEALASFGDGRVFVERLVDRPRHIEVQVLADSHGNVVHLGERECSIQRRYQKIIEESPSPFIDHALRVKVGENAVALAREVGYESAGTVEMIVDSERRFYFLEMNARLQVEHPVTELVTGIDLVAEQVRVAAGEPLSIRQEDVAMRGHAIECRIYAEDADNGFVPAAGRLGLVRFPAGDGIRVDHGVLEGQHISASFDPMIAKLAIHGPTREAAITHARDALRDTVLLGTITNIAFLERVLAHPAFVAGDIDTGFIGEHAVALASPAADEDMERCLVAAAALATSRFDHRFTVPQPLASMGAWGR